MQNTSHAVMSQRIEPRDGLDDFPTPPWATRALIQHVIKPTGLKQQTCLEPTCGRGYMANTLAEYFSEVRSADIFDYGYGEVRNFLTSTPAPVDWIITNPPFNQGMAFVLHALTIARRGVAMLTRTVFLEGDGRHKRLFTPHPPTMAAQFVQRVTMLHGRFDRNVNTATAYAWMVWTKGHTGPPRVVWIPPCKKALERPGDYDTPSPVPPTAKRRQGHP